MVRKLDISKILVGNLNYTQITASTFKGPQQDWHPRLRKDRSSCSIGSRQEREKLEAVRPVRKMFLEVAVVGEEKRTGLRDASLAGTPGLCDWTVREKQAETSHEAPEMIFSRVQRSTCCPARCV